MILSSQVAETIATQRWFIAGRTVRIAVFLLLFVLLGPPGVSPCSDDVPGNPTIRRGMVGDNSVAILRKLRVSERLFGLPGLTNVGRVAPGIFRGAQPESEGYSTLKAMGVRTVINLRTRHGEREAVQAAGMRYVEIPMNVMKSVNPADVRNALSVMTDPANHGVFVHCSQGKDRTGVVVALYRMEVDGWSETEAEAEMEAFGFHEVWAQLKSFLRRLPEDRKRGLTGDGP